MSAQRVRHRQIVSLRVGTFGSDVPTLQKVPFELRMSGPVRSHPLKLLLTFREGIVRLLHLGTKSSGQGSFGINMRI